MRIIGLGKFFDLNQNRGEMDPQDFANERDILSRKQTKRALSLFWSTKKESEALLACRRSLARILTNTPTVTFGPVANINNNAFHTFITWFVNMHMIPFKVAPRTLPTVLLLALCAKSHIKLPDFEAGEPLPNVANLGDKESGKSFAMQIMALIHLAGVVYSANNISTQAFISGKNISAAILPPTPPHRFNLPAVRSYDLAPARGTAGSIC